MTPIIPITFRQRTDVYQVIRFKNNERRGIGTVLIQTDIQEVELGMPPKIRYSIGKLLIEANQIISHLPTFLRHFIHGMNIQELVIGSLKANPNPTNCFQFRPFHRSFPRFLREKFIQFFRDRNLQNSLISLDYRTDIAKKLIYHRLLAPVHHVIGGKAKCMQGVLDGIFQRELCGQIIDACRQVGGLQRYILHPFTGYPFERLAQRAITMTQRTIRILAKRPQIQIDFSYLLTHIIYLPDKKVSTCSQI